MTKLFFLSFLIFNFTWSSAQITNNYHNYSINEGLPSSQVYSMTEDSHGYLWFFTDHGISRYDGYKFENFNKNNGLCDDVNFNYFKTGDEIWIIGQNNSISIIKGKEPEFKPYAFNDSIKKYCKHNPTELYIDEQRNLIINFEFSVGFLKIDNFGRVLEIPQYILNSDYKKKHYTHIYNKSLSIQVLSKSKKYTSKSFVYNRVFTKSKGVIINHNNFAFIKGDSTIEIHNKRQTKLIFHNNNALNIGILDSSTYWISFIGDGLKLYNTGGEVIGTFLSGKTVTSYYTDKEKNRWFSTINSGAFMLPANQFNKIQDIKAESNNISDIEISNSTLYVGYKTGRVYQLNHNNFNPIYVSSWMKPIHFANHPKKNSLFFIADRSLLEYNGKLNTVYTNIPIGKRMKFIYDCTLCYSGVYGIHSLLPTINSIKHKIDDTYDFEVYQDDLLLATRNGLYQFTDDKRTKIMNKRINILTIINCTLFIGTHGDGLYLYKGDTQPEKFNSDQLKGSYISCIKQQNDTTVWIGTNTGLFKIEFQSNTNFKKYSVFNFNEYIPEKEVTDIELLNDTLWVATNNGLYFSNVNSKHTVSIRNINYHLDIENLKINDQISDTIRIKNLSYDKNRLTINYKAIKFEHGHDIKYRYKLIGLESEWNYSEKLSITYASLPPGNYEFIIQVKENNTYWETQQRNLIITINQPYWKTIWFITTITTAIILLIYLFFKYRILLYNKDIIREMLRHFLRIIKKDEKIIIIKVSGSEVKLITSDILFVKSDGNYLEVHTVNQKYLTREKISNFLSIVPDPIEFMQVRRSHIVRLDKVTEKGKKHIIVGDVTIQVGETFLEKLKLIDFSIK